MPSYRRSQDQFLEYLSARISRSQARAGLWPRSWQTASILQQIFTPPPPPPQELMVVLFCEYVRLSNSPCCAGLS